VEHHGANLYLSQQTTFSPANWQNKGRWEDLSTSVSAYGTGTKSMAFDNYNINATNERDDIFTPYYLILFKY
jgi:hypothetical protein